MNEEKDIFLAANLGSEIARLLVAKREHDSERMRGAYARACAIIEELEAQTDAGGRREAAMLKAVLDDLVREKPLFTIQPKVLRAYFLPFALRALTKEGMVKIV